MKSETSEGQNGKTTNVPAHVASDQESHASAARLSGPLPTGSGVVLVVDDEVSVRHYARRVLEKAGFQAHLANDGPEGLEIFRKHSNEIKAVVVDMTMCGMDGQETMRRVRALQPTVPVLIMSGYAEEEMAKHFIGMDVTGFIQKPFNPRDFASIVCRVVAGDRPSAP